MSSTNPLNNLPSDSMNIEFIAPRQSIQSKLAEKISSLFCCCASNTTSSDLDADVVPLVMYSKKETAKNEEPTVEEEIISNEELVVEEEIVNNEEPAVEEEIVSDEELVVEEEIVNNEEIITENDTIEDAEQLDILALEDAPAPLAQQSACGRVSAVATLLFSVAFGTALYAMGRNAGNVNDYYGYNYYNGTYNYNQTSPFFF
ncbi:MAG: hypothetical protein CMO81_09255 [Waddliaceae bacterium]|nr:hypothetical protein [Waddliaceae bacterium]